MAHTSGMQILDGQIDIFRALVQLTDNLPGGSLSSVWNNTK